MTLPINEATRSLLHPEECIQNMDPESLRKWLENGLDPDLRDSDGMTLLIHSLGYTNIECCRKLLVAGANPNLGSKTTPEMFPIHFAARIAHTPAFNLLVEYGADIEALTPDTNKRLIDIIVKRSKCEGMLRTLLAKGIKADKTLLNEAILSKQRGNIEILLRHGVEMGDDSWVYAITSDQEEFILALLDDIRLRTSSEVVPVIPARAKGLQL